MNQKLVTALIAASAALVTGVLGAVLGYVSNNRQMDVKMAEIAVGILSQEPKENIAPAREWAVDVIDHYAQVPLNPAVRTALVNNKALGLGFVGRADAASGAFAAALETLKPASVQPSR